VARGDGDWGKGIRKNAASGSGIRPTAKANVLRTIAAAVMALSIVWMGWGILAPPQQAQSATGPVEVVNYTVRPGDTLWSYARNITPEGGNVANTVQELKKLNNMDSSALQPGQSLLVPAR
jgi:LysM repeat protein